MASSETVITAPGYTPDPVTAEADARKSMRKVALTSLAGTSIEWYDFFLYGTAAALVFPILFFPADMPATVALMASFSTFAIGFIARPLGGVIFGHYGDRVGRKKVLVIALMMMAVATTLIGFLPTYQTAGALAPLSLILLRFIQGLAIGGQWGGAMLLVTESAPAHKRGWYGAYAQAGAPIGNILASLAFLILVLTLSEEAFLSWGWRLPFIASIVLIGISIYVQLHLEDSAAFKALEELKQEKRKAGVLKSAATVERSPVIEVIMRHPKRIMLAAGAFLSIQVSFYILIAFVVAYGTSSAGVGLPRNTILAAVLIACALQVPLQFWAAHYSDIHGRRGIFMLGALLTGLWAFALFPLIDTGNFFLITLSITVGASLISMQYGPQAAFFTELFSTRIRYSGASLGYQIGAILGGALAPMIAVFLWTEYGIFYVSVYIMVASLITLWCVWMLTETHKSDIHEDHG